MRRHVPPEAARAKRPKIDIACDPCRSRKVKCDGLRPACSGCLKRKDRGPRCAYSVPNDPNSDGRPPPSTSPEQVLGLEASGDPRSNGTPPPQPGLGIISAAEMHQAPVAILAPLVDSTGASGSGSHALFGSNRAGSFMMQMKAAIDKNFQQPSCASSQAGPGESSIFALSSSDQEQRHNDPHVDYVLPRRKTADELIATYWDAVHPLCPFLDRGAFEMSYQSVWTGEASNGDERILICTTNVMFALACRLTDTLVSERGAAASMVYFKRAQKLLDLDLWSTGSVQLIQCLLLMGQYLQSTSAPHHCWMIVGHAIRLAQGLGLHLVHKRSPIPSAEEREVANRNWHGCVLMDRIISMTFGRPVMISKTLAASVPLPSTIDADVGGHFSVPVDEPSYCASGTAFFVKILELYGIVDDILAAVYISDGNLCSSDVLGPFPCAKVGLATILGLDDALMAWGRTLPPNIRISSDVSFESTTSRRQAILCRTSFLHTRILLLRPVLAKYCVPDALSSATGTFLDEGLTQQVIQQCSNLCLMAAHDLIGIIYANLNAELSTPLPPWWYCVFYVYNAATVLLAAQLKPLIEGGIVGYSRRQSWDHAMAILKSCQKYGDSAHRCVAVLELLSAKISETKDGDTGNSTYHSEPDENLVKNNTLEGEPYPQEFGMEFDFSGFKLI